MLLLFALAGLLQGTAPSPRDTATLYLGARAVTTFRVALGAATPADRADAATRRIDAALAAGADTVITRPSADGVLFLIGTHPVFLLTAADADTAGGQTLTGVATLTAERLRTGVAEQRESRSLPTLLAALAQGLAASAALALLVVLLVRGRRRLDARLRGGTKGIQPRVSLRGVTLLRPAQVLTMARVAIQVVAWGLGLVAAYLYLTFVLTRFPATRAWGQALGGYLVGTLARLGLGALRTIPGLFTVALIFVLARFAAGLLRTAFDAVASGRLTLPGVHPDTARPTRRIATALLWMFALVVAYPYVPGSDSAAFKGVSVFAGILVSLGSAGLVGQAMSGLVLMYSRAFKEGDFIQAGAVQGTVQALGLLSTRVRTPKNEYVTLPNSVVTAGSVVNYSAPQRNEESLTIYASVTIGYDTPWRQVHEIMLAAAGKVEGARRDPAPYVLQRALDDSYVEYQINVAIDPERAPELPRFYSGLYAGLQDAFAEAGVEIMSPRFLAVRDGNAPTLPQP